MKDYEVVFWLTAKNLPDGSTVCANIYVLKFQTERPQLSLLMAPLFFITFVHLLFAPTPYNRSCQTLTCVQHWQPDHPLPERKGCVAKDHRGVRLLVRERQHALCPSPLPLWKQKGVRGYVPCRLYRRRHWPDKRMVSCDQIVNKGVMNDRKMMDYSSN